MKRLIYLFTIVLLTVSLFASAKPKKPKPSNLPINTSVVYLVAAGLAIGVFAVRKSKSAKAGLV